MAPQPQLVLVEWLDGGRPASGWQSLADLDQRTPYKCVSVGFLIEDGEQTKVIAPNLGASNGDDAWDQVSGLISIATASIVKIRQLSAFSLSSLSNARRPPLAESQWLRKLA